MKYLSAMRRKTGDIETIVAMGDDGLEYFIPSVETDVPPWPQFLAEGGIITDEVTDIGQQITEAPDNLTGGPTIQEVFNGNG